MMHLLGGDHHRSHTDADGSRLSTAALDIRLCVLTLRLRIMSLTRCSVQTANPIVDDTSIGFTYHPITLTLISSRRPARLAKNYYIAKGKLEVGKTGQLSEGTVQRLTLSTLTDLAELLEALESHQALCYGLPDRDGPIVASPLLARHPDALTRTREDFDWADGAGVLMIDMDYADTLEPMDAVRRIRALSPALADVEMLWRASASSGIRSADGKIDTGLRGQRLYLIVDRADRIPEVGRAIADLLWAAQDPACRFDVASNGRLNQRQLVDALVWQPERFDFAAASVLADKRLSRHAPEPFFTGIQGTALDTEALLSGITAEQRAAAQSHKATLKRAAAQSDECLERTAQFVETRAKALEQRGVKRATARESVRRAMQQNTLDADFTLLHSSGRTVALSEILRDPEHWHGERFADPVEPDYHNDRRIAVALYRDGRLSIYSHAHGGITYRVEASAPSTPAPREVGISRRADALVEDLSACQSTDDACKLVARHAWRCPWQIAPGALVEAVMEAAPDVDRAAVAETLARVLSHQTAASMAAIRVSGAKAVATLDTLAESLVEGVYVIKSPHATGKTYRVLKPIVEANADARILAVTNRVSLTGANAKTLGLDDYRFLDEIDSGGISTCINSICNPMVEARAKGAKVVVIDEAAACLRELHSRGSTMGSEAPKIRARLGSLIDESRLTVLADADWSDADTAALRAMTARPVVVLERPEDLRDLRALFTDEARALSDLVSAIENGRRCLVACASSRRVEWLTRYLRERYPARNIRGIHAREGMATSGNVENIDLLRNIDTEVERQGIDVLLYTSVVESGVSLNVAHFDRHFAFYGGEIAPSALNQMLRRDRTARRWTVGICGSGTRGEKARTAQDFEREHEAAARASGSEAMRDDFEVCSNRYAAQAERASSHWAQSLWVTLRARGWILERGGVGTGDMRALLKLAREQGATRARIAFTELVQSVETPTAGEYERLSKAYSITTRQSAAIARFEIMQLFDVVTRREIDLFQRGELKAQVRWYRLATQGPAPEAESGISRALRTFSTATANALGVLFAHLGLDIESGTADAMLTHDSCLAVYEALAGTDDARILSRAGIARFNAKPKAAVTWVSRILKKFGLALEKHGQTRADGRLYVIRADMKRNKAGDIIAPGLAVMREVSSRNTSSYSALESEVLPIDEDLLWALKEDTEALIERLIERCIERRKAERRAAA